jgi:ABC-type uncharacterized transport system YnjBCD permease subunit
MNMSLLTNTACVVGAMFIALAVIARCTWRRPKWGRYCSTTRALSESIELGRHIV